MIAGAERMDAGWRERKAEAPQASFGPREIVDANDDVIDEAGQFDLPVMQARTVTRAANAAQSIVYDIKLKTIYCRPPSGSR
jgi:hypothetical protein